MSDPIPLQEIRLLEALVLSQLDLSREEESLVEAVVENRPIQETLILDGARLSWSGSGELGTDVAGLDLSLTPSLGVGLELRLYAPEEEIDLGGATLPPVHRSRRTLALPAREVACGIELQGRLGLQAEVLANAPQWRWGISAQAGLGIALGFVKTFPAETGAQDLIRETLGSLTTLFHARTRPPGEGEVVITDFQGTLKLGATASFGWTLTGTSKLTRDLGDVDLFAPLEVGAQLGLTADLSIEQEVRVIVQRAPRGGSWVNVCFLKKNENDRELAANLGIVAALEHRGDDETVNVGPFLDSVFNRTPLPELLAELRGLDTSVNDEGIAALQGELVERVRHEIESVLEEPVARAQEVVERIERETGRLLETYLLLDEDVARFLEEALERTRELVELDEAIDVLARTDGPEGVLVLLAGEENGPVIRDLLGISSVVLGLDLSQVSWLEDEFRSIQSLVRRYGQLDRDLRNGFEQAYRWLQAQLQWDRAVERIQAFLDAEVDLPALLDEGIVWLNEYLSQEVGRTVEELSQALEPVTAALGSIVEGFESLRGKAQGALEKALRRELSLRVNLAWKRLTTSQAVVSVDLNLDEEAGREALEASMRGDLSSLMKDRLSHPEAIRLQKSYFLDQLRRDLSLRIVLNGRESLKVKSYLVSRRAVLEPTEDGEIWIQESGVESRFRRSNRRALIDVSTMFQVTLVQRLVHSGRVLESEGIGVEGYNVRYLYREKLQGEPSAFDIAQRLVEIKNSLDFDPVPLADFSFLLEAIQRVGALGKLGKPTIDVVYQIDRDALMDVFSTELEPSEVRAALIAAWDRAVVDVFGGLPRVMRFYAAKKESLEDLVELKAAVWDLRLVEQVMCRELIHRRASVTKLLSNMHRHVFRRLEEGKLVGYLRDLGKQMNWLNSLEGEVTRNFFMSIFSNLVDESERGGSIVVRYDHPVTQEDMELRADSPSPALAVE